MATTDGVHLFSNLRNVVLNQPAVTVFNQPTVMDLHAALRFLYNASARYAGAGHPDAASSCLEGTRVSALGEIDEWKQKQLQSTSISEMLWLTGSAGTGKSAIAQTVCERCKEEGIPVVHCFLSNSSGRTHAAYVFLTIAYQLAVTLPVLKASIEAAVQADPSIVDAPLDTQLHGLILDPMTSVASQLPMVLVVIDGLDECKGEREQIHILNLIQSTIQGRPFPIRFLVASRPEPWIRNTLLSPSAPTVSMVSLNQSKDTDNDIWFFYVSEFRKICDDPEHQESLLTAPMPWPSNSDLVKLVNRASGQFMYAKLVTSFVGEAGHQCVDRLNLITAPNTTTLSTPLDQLDALYTRILSSVPDWTLTSTVLGSLIKMHTFFQDRLTREFLSILEVLLGLKRGDSERALRNLHSVVFVPKGLSSERESTSLDEYIWLLGAENQYPRFLHKSFTDFLCDSQRAGPFFVNLEEIHRMHALGCLEVLQNVASALHSRLFCVTWSYALRFWNFHSTYYAGNRGNRPVLEALNRFSLTSHYFLPRETDRPKARKRMAALELLEKRDDEALEAIKQMEHACKTLHLPIYQNFSAGNISSWIEEQVDISQIEFPKLRLKFWFLCKMWKDMR